MSAVFAYLGAALVFVAVVVMLYHNHAAELARRRLMRTLDHEARRRVDGARRG